MNLVKSLQDGAAQLAEGNADAFAELQKHGKKSRVVLPPPKESKPDVQVADAKAADDFLKILDRALIQKSERCPVSDATIKHVASLAPKLSEKEKTAILEAVAALENCRAQVLSHTDLSAKKAWLDHNETLAQKMSRGEKLDREDGWTRLDFEQDFAAKMEIAKTGGTRACATLISVLKNPVARFIQFTEALAEKVQSEEEEIFQEFAVSDFQPSAVVRSIRAVGNLARLHNCTRPHYGFNPSEILRFLNIQK